MTGLLSLAERYAPDAAAVALHALRLMPVALLSPFLGGPMVPAVVRLSLAAGLGAVAHATGGAATLGFDHAVGWVVAGAREVTLGIAFGLLAALPFEAARAGGRLADTLRGATLAELHVAPVRQRETALGDLLAQWAVVLAATAGADRLVVSSILGSFAAVPAGAAWARGPVLEASLRGAGELVASALALGAPAAAGVLAAELAVVAAARFAPQLGIAAATQPARAALGVLGVAVPASALGARLVELAVLSSGLVRAGTSP